MLFTHDTELNLGFLPQLCNSVPGASESGAEELATPQDLHSFLSVWKFSGRVDADQAELKEVHDARDRIRKVWGADEHALVVWVNGILSGSKAVPRLVNHDDIGWHIHAIGDDAPLAQRILVESAMSFVDVIRGGRVDRLRVCKAVDCDGILVDLSRNGTKRFCSTRCGNRMAVRAYRARTAN